MVRRVDLDNVAGLILGGVLWMTSLYQLEIIYIWIGEGRTVFEMPFYLWTMSLPVARDLWYAVNALASPSYHSRHSHMVSGGRGGVNIRRTRVSWWIRDGAATLEGWDVVQGQASVPEAEAMLDRATSLGVRDLESLPGFCSRFHGCGDPEDWGVRMVEEEFDGW